MIFCLTVFSNVSKQRNRGCDFQYESFASEMAGREPRGHRCKKRSFKRLKCCNCASVRLISPYMSEKQSDCAQPALSAGLKPLFTMRGHKLAVSAVKCDSVFPATFTVPPLIIYKVMFASFSGSHLVRGFCFRRLRIKRCSYGTCLVASV